MAPAGSGGEFWVEKVARFTRADQLAERLFGRPSWGGPLLVALVWTLELLIQGARRLVTDVGFAMRFPFREYWYIETLAVLLVAVLILRLRTEFQTMQRSLRERPETAVSPGLADATFDDLVSATLKRWLLGLMWLGLALWYAATLFSGLLPAAAGDVSKVFNPWGVWHLFLVIPFLWAPILAEGLAVVLGSAIHTSKTLYRDDLRLNRMDPMGCGGFQPVRTFVSRVATGYLVVVFLLTLGTPVGMAGLQSGFGLEVPWFPTPHLPPDMQAVPLALSGSALAVGVAMFVVPMAILAWRVQGLKDDAQAELVRRLGKDRAVLEPGQPLRVSEGEDLHRRELLERQIERRIDQIGDIRAVPRSTLLDVEFLFGVAMNLPFLF